MLTSSRINANGRTTVPREVRVALDCNPGDSIAWQIGADGCVAVRRILLVDAENLSAAQDGLSEWLTRADEEAYGKL